MKSICLIILSIILLGCTSEPIVGDGQAGIGKIKCFADHANKPIMACTFNELNWNTISTPETYTVQCIGSSDKVVIAASKCFVELF